MTILEQYLNSQSAVFVIDRTIPLDRYTALDLSANNVELNAARLENPEMFGSYINNFLQDNNALVGYGGYLETRNLYQRSTIFNGNIANERNIHIGIDLWINAGTPVLAALEGTIHSFAHNLGLGNYGPTVIMQHQYDDYTFYTLYGHLSVESIDGLEIGATFAKGQQIAQLGEYTVNGDYPPHLHFQIIDDINGLHGDYPGVCSINDVDYYRLNCPDPNLLLKIY